MPSGVLLKLSFGLSRAMLSRNSVSLVSNASQFSSRRSLARTSMAASCSKAVFGDLHIDDLIATCGNGLEFPKSSGVFFSDRSRSSCVKASVKMRNGELPKSLLVCGNAIRKNGNANNLVLGPILKNLYSSSSVCVSGRAQDVSFDGNFSEEQLVDSTAVSGLNLKLLSGSCYLPHPDKEETGGEDAHFICEDEQAIGIADGVGGWADVGVNAGVLEKAHANMKARGSSTACIIALKSEGLHAINLGDSGFMVVRDGCTIFESPVQQHGFNFTYQLESGNGGDLPSSGQVFTIPVAPGDVIIAGTDGLFDNLYNNEVTAVVVHAIRTGLGPEATAQKIAALARQRALDTNRQTPFSTAAQDAGYRYYGGKLDDITVVVSYVTNSANI
ncbi:PROTEIN PHOSPHATASE 2C [Salix viminalis]|uniref:Protein phosphatase n=1 Tax=Salix viminalis TaxID=40686 RepID=A0A9Q0NZ37_SALVM|nr:PROTEIN PHOSPHATASE 2C [Salix viminalis]